MWGEVRGEGEGRDGRDGGTGGVGGEHPLPYGSSLSNQPLIFTDKQSSSTVSHNNPGLRRPPAPPRAGPGSGGRDNTMAGRGFIGD